MLFKYASSSVKQIKLVLKEVNVKNANPELGFELITSSIRVSFHNH